jgi:hypothetical protein
MRMPIVFPSRAIVVATLSSLSTVVFTLCGCTRATQLSASALYARSISLEYCVSIFRPSTTEPFTVHPVLARTAVPPRAIALIRSERSASLAL